VRFHFGVAYAVVAGLLLMSPRAGCQVQAGDLSMNLNGMLTSTYDASYGNVVESSHGLGFGGNGTLSGYYYNPNFLNFSFTPYYDQSRANSNFRSVFQSSGFDFSSGIFGGSHFPGSIGYGRTYNSEGTFGLPGVAENTTNGSSDTFHVSWSEFLPGLPSLTAGFQTGSSQYSLFGTDENGHTHFHGWNLRSGYQLEGFNLGAYYSNSSSHVAFPELFGSALQETTSDSDSQTYGFSVSHSLPLKGSFSSNLNRTAINSDYLGYSFDGTIDTVNASLGFQPLQKLHVQASTSYSDNLSGLLYQALIPSGSAVPNGENLIPLVGNLQSAHAWDVMTSVSYSIASSLQAQAYGERRKQTYRSQAYGADTVGGGLSYSRVLFGGNFHVSGFATDNTSDSIKGSNLGLNTSVGYTRAIGAWNVGGDFSYAQNMQLLLVTYTTSYYFYTGSVRRHLRSNLTWSGTAAGSRTGLTAQPRTGNSSQSYSTGLSYSHWIGASASYAKSDGHGLQTGTGFIPTPIPPIVPQSLLVLFGGQSYSFSLSSTPLRHFSVAGAYSHANLNTMNGTSAFGSRTEQYFASVQYQFRKMGFTGGYTRLLQGFSATGTPPAIVSSYYMGVSRWFNFF